MPQHQDEGFSLRLLRRDRAVLIAIDLAYSGHLRRSLRKCYGLQDSDADIVVYEALQLTWEKFKTTTSSSVRAFYFGIARNRALTLKRTARRRRRRERSDVEALAASPSETPTPYHAIVDAESAEARVLMNSQLKILMDQVVSQLTPRQRLAYERRFNHDEPHWAKTLAKETGTASQAWRKASDEAVNKIKQFLANHGVVFSREEGRFEVA